MEAPTGAHLGREDCLRRPVRNVDLDVFDWGVLVVQEYPERSEAGEDTVVTSGQLHELGDVGEESRTHSWVLVGGLCEEGEMIRVRDLKGC